MVVALGPGKFYGSSLPRPRFYSDVKLSGERVDPPLPVMDALMAWAEEAHWSMGGSSTARRRLQGRIEGNVNRLRVQRETLFKKSGKQQKSVFSPAPRVSKRRRVVGLVDEDEVEEEEEEEEPRGMKKEAARKLREGFEKATGNNEDQRGKVSDGDGVEVAIKKEAEFNKVYKKSAEGRRGGGAAAAGVRSSPRLGKVGRSR
ncbi:hypothetical protein C2S51_015273 [Perilla frutescens var. frutescens]|nr:hypothetical protein C2S51_015273 [Perilla frutescens var. frutescens]